jgi:hypothetical protein
MAQLLAASINHSNRKLHVNQPQDAGENEEA